MRRLLMVVLLSTAVAGCGHVGSHKTQWIDPAMAVQLAAAAGPGRGVEGVFALQVRATGEDAGRLFLGSQADYRDPRNLSVALDPQVLPALAERLQANPAVALMGKPILVRGTARLVRIDFTKADGSASGKYYYQTHVRVSDAAQIQLR
jgi:hypothetical protein